MPRTPRWTDEQLRDAVAESRSLGEVCRRLELRPGGGTYKTLQRHIARLGIDHSHLPKLVDGHVRPPRNWTDDQLRNAVRESYSVAAVLRALGYEPSGGMHRYIKMQIQRLGLDTSHFTGQAWAKGRRGQTGFKSRPLMEVLVVNSPYTSSANLRKRLVAEGVKEPRCELCGIHTWRGQPLPLALDHVNGDPCDNRLGNLRILCPNCHALTETWCGRNRGRRTPMQRDQA